MLKRSLAVLATAMLVSLSACSDDPADDDATAGDPGAAESSESSGETAGECAYPEDGRPAAKEVSPPPGDAEETGERTVTIATGVGDLEVNLDGAAAPCTVNSFLSLAEQGYYDGTTCHRLTTEGIFVLQCGDPTGTGSGGPGYQFDDELSGSETYPAGTVAMANAGPGTNGSQFFLVYEDTELPPAYTVFGTMSEDSVATVAEVAAKGTAEGAPDGTPKQEVTIESVG